MTPAEKAKIYLTEVAIMSSQPAKGNGREVWQHLLEGNQRFVQGMPLGRNLQELRQTLVQGQKPKAAVLCCSDSRVAPEIIFDQTLGDLFVVRTAGLVLDPTSLGSLEYAVDHLGVPLLILLGHEKCGAVTGAVLHPQGAPGHIAAIVEQLTPAVGQARLSGKNGPELVEAAAEEFLYQLKDSLPRQSAIISQALREGRLPLVVAKYHLSDGCVDALYTSFA